MKKFFIYLPLLIVCFLVGYFFGSNKTEIPVCTVSDMKKAEEVQKFLSIKNLPTHIEIWENNIQIYLNSTYEVHNNDARIYLAESNLVDDSMKYIHPYFKNPNFVVEINGSYENYRKALEKGLKNTIKKIDGVVDANVSIEIKKEINDKNETITHFGPIIINIDVFEDFNTKKIEQTIKNLLKGQDYSINLKSVGYDKIRYVFWNFDRYSKKIAELYDKKEYENAIKLINEANEKRSNSFSVEKIECIKKLSELDKKISKNPSNYKLYLERGKLLAPDENVYSFFKCKHSCCSIISNKDIENVKTDLKKALELNPNAKEVYELLFWTTLYSKYPKAPIYTNEALEYGLKAVEYSTNYRLYEELASTYYNLDNYYMGMKYHLISEQKREEEQAKLDEGELLEENPFIKPFPIIELNIIDKIQNKIYFEPKYCTHDLKNYKKAISYADVQIKENADENSNIIKQELQKKFEEISNSNFSCKMISKFYLNK